MNFEQWFVRMNFKFCLFSFSNQQYLEKILSSWWDFNLRPSEHWADALIIELTRTLGQRGHLLRSYRLVTRLYYLKLFSTCLFDFLFKYLYHFPNFVFTYSNHLSPYSWWVNSEKYNAYIIFCLCLTLTKVWMGVCIQFSTFTVTFFGRFSSIS